MLTRRIVSSGARQGLRQKRQLHLQQATALDIIEEAGVKVLPFQLVKTSSGFPTRRGASEGQRFTIRPQVTDAAGLEPLVAGRFGNLKGISFECTGFDEAERTLETIFSTPFHLPTGPTGMQDRRVEGASLFAGTIDYSRTISVLFYCDRSGEHGGPAMLAARADELDPFTSLRNFAASNPSKANFLPITIETGLSKSDAKSFLEPLSPEISNVDSAAEALTKVYHDVFVGKDALRVEAFLSYDEKGNVVTTDARIELDDFSAARQPLLTRIKASGAQLHLHPAEVEAAKGGLFYIKPFNDQEIKGNIGCFGYGAGLAMATMDAVVSAGGKPANFLDGGGGATAANAKLAIQVLSTDPDVKVIFVNIFGGITQTDKVAAGIIEAVKESERKLGLEVKMVIRMRGTGEEEAKRLLESSQIPFIIEDDFAEAARKAVEATLVK